MVVLCKCKIEVLTDSDLVCSNLIFKNDYFLKKVTGTRKRRRHSIHTNRIPRSSDPSRGRFLVQSAAKWQWRLPDSTRRLSGPIRKQMGEQQVDS